MRLCHLQRPICITLLLALSGCAIPAAYIPLASAALGFAAAEVSADDATFWVFAEVHDRLTSWLDAVEATGKFRRRLPWLRRLAATDVGAVVLERALRRRA